MHYCYWNSTLNQESFHVVLYHPKIPYNTGNIVRLCANTGASLHLIEPISFKLDDSKMKRAGLDYSDMTTITTHKSLPAYTKRFPARRLICCSPQKHKLYTEISYSFSDSILFGSEDKGIPKSILSRSSNLISIPMRPSNRSLNLSNAAAIVIYEAWRQLKFNTASA